MKKRGKARVEVDNTSIFLSDLLMMIDMIFMQIFFGKFDTLF